MATVGGASAECRATGDPPQPEKTGARVPAGLSGPAGRLIWAWCSKAIVEYRPAEEFSENLKDRTKFFVLHYQIVRTGYWVMRGSGVSRTRECSIAWQIRILSKGSL